MTLIIFCFLSKTKKELEEFWQKLTDKGVPLTTQPREKFEKKNKFFTMYADNCYSSKISETEIADIICQIKEIINDKKIDFRFAVYGDELLINTDQTEEYISVRYQVTTKTSEKDSVITERYYFNTKELSDAEKFCQRIGIKTQTDIFQKLTAMRNLNDIIPYLESQKFIINKFHSEIIPEQTIENYYKNWLKEKETKYNDDEHNEETEIEEIENVIYDTIEKIQWISEKYGHERTTTEILNLINQYIARRQTNE